MVYIFSSNSSLTLKKVNKHTIPSNVLEQDFQPQTAAHVCVCMRKIEAVSTK